MGNQSVIATLAQRAAQANRPEGAWDPCAPAPPLREEANHRMRGYFTALGLPMLLCVAGAASATTATIDFNTPANTTANTQLLATGPNGKTTTTNVGGRNAVQTGGTTDNEFLYVSLPK